MLLTETLDRCPICGGKALRHLLDAPDHESNTGTYGIDECADCGVGFTNPRPLESELPKLYEERSTADFPRTAGLVQGLRDYAVDRYLGSQLGAVLAPVDGEFRALDFGCGDGALVRGLLRLGASRTVPMRVTAVDFHDTAPPALAGIGAAVRYIPFEQWRGTDERYDAIFLRHVLEHHPDPCKLLRDLGQTLRPGGHVFVEVPNRRSVWARVFGGSYFGYYLPRHLIHFDPKSLSETFRRAGFANVNMRLGHTPLLGRSIDYATGSNLGNTGIAGLATYPVQVGLDILAGRSSTLRASGRAA